MKWASMSAAATSASKPKERVLVFRIGSLGDSCVALPAFRLIRQSYQDADIRVLTNFPIGQGVKAAPLQTVIGQSGLVDGYFQYPIGLNSWNGFRHCVCELFQWRPDVVIYLMPRRSVAQLGRDFMFFRWVLGIKKIKGLSFNRKAQKCMWDEQRQTFEKEASRLIRNLDTLGSIDLSCKTTWDLGLKASEITQVGNFLESWPGTKNFIVCAVGTKIDTKDWEQSRWEAWAKTLSNQYPDLGLLLIGVAVELERSEHVSRHWRGPKLNLCGKLTPRESGALLRQARCFVGHDSGPMHLAAAVGTPCVAVFSAQERPGIWFPYGGQHQVIYHKTECFGCRLEVCEKYQKECIRSITVEEVVQATKVLLSSSAPQAVISL